MVCVVYSCDGKAEFSAAIAPAALRLGLTEKSYVS